MSEWRPDGWDDWRANRCETRLYSCRCVRCVTTEDAVDAVLVALKERDGSEYYPPEEGRIQSGWVVFIPDEDK